jgi:uncharacterized protein YceH (UPF0502 family)
VSEPLTDADVRVLGSLIEKEQTTPEYYPLSLNALVNACNQSSNRDPVVKYDEGIVTRSIESLRSRGLVRASRGIDARVLKYAHRVDDVMGLNVQQIAILCVLMLRGPQTPGELRTRTSRMEAFDDVATIEARLDELIIKEFVVRFPRQPGQKEVRYAHLLCGEVSVDAMTSMPQTRSTGTGDRVAALEQVVEELRKEVAELRTQLATFRAQFE